VTQVTRYAELHSVSNFTFLRGASHPGDLIHQAANLGYSALALTDECSMAGVVRAHEAAKERDFKLVVGSEFRSSNDLHLVLLAPSQTAYAQICQLITVARSQAKKGEYQLSRAQFEDGLSECLALWIAPRNALPSQAAWLRECFPERCWIAVERHRQSDDAKHLAHMQRLGRHMGLPLVASGDVHMHVREQRALQDTVTAIRHRCTLAAAGHRLFANGERHLRPLDMLAELYPAPLLEETLRIAERCEFSLGSLSYSYPREIVPEGLTATQHLRNLAEAGARQRWPAGVPERIKEIIEKELALIEQLKYEHFFLTVQEIVAWARSDAGLREGEVKKPILCQGRGSAANSIVCYALYITEVNPDDIQVLFERFLSQERNEPPDIDVDFEHERREEVIQHIFLKYGRARAAIAATVITYRSRSAIRDVGKALGLGEDIVDRLAKSHAWWDNWEQLHANMAALGLHVDESITQRLCYLVNKLLNFPRHLSQHVGGFVIAEQPISELVPIENAAMPDRTIIQWDKNDLEALGLLKVDVLALGMLTAMRKTFDLLATAEHWPTQMERIPREDSQTYDMICRADTVGVFQVESRAQMSMLPRLKPRTYYDLVIEIAIVRPGPIKGGMVHPYLQRRGMRPEDVPYASEALRPVLEKTRGVPIFQEQVMQIAIVAADFTAGEADQLRRAMGAWQRSGKMGMYRERLMQGMLKKGYSQEFAEQIFKQIEGFGEYGFPESHSASFALLTYISSWLKCHRPAAFIAGLINSQPMGFYQPAQLLEQAKRQRVKILPVDVTASDYDCTLEADGHKDNEPWQAIRLGMRLIKGLRKEDAQNIVAARALSPFVSVEDVAHRSGLGARAAKALAISGALRSLSEHRNLAFWSALGVESLPGALAGHAAFEPPPQLPIPTEWEEIQRDYRQMGLSTGRHPLAVLRPKLRASGISSRREIDSMRHGRMVRVGGLVTHLQHPQTANGVIFASLEDETGINNIIFRPGIFELFRQRILQANFMVVSGELQSQESVIHVVASSVEDYSHWVRTLPRKSRDFH
jgi:error-prone DNA polymerase